MDGTNAHTQSEDLEATAYEKWKESMELFRRAIDEKPDETMLILCDLVLQEKEGEDAPGLSKIYGDVASVIRHKLTGEVACKRDSEFWNLADCLRDQSLNPRIYGFDIFNKPQFQWTPRGGIFTRPPGINEIASFFFSNSFEGSLHHPIACICRTVFEGVPVYRRDETGVFERLSFDHPDVVLMTCLGRDSLTIDTTSIPNWIKNYWFRSGDVVAHKIFFKSVEWNEESEVVDTLRNSYHRHIFPNGIPAKTTLEEKLVLEREVQDLRRRIKALENDNNIGAQQVEGGIVRPEDKPLETRERNVLLCIIASLCKDMKYDYTKHSKIAGLIQSSAARMGISIGETTIEGHLRKIPNALETRMK